MNQVRRPFGLLVQEFGRPCSQIRGPKRPGDCLAAVLHSGVILPYSGLPYSGIFRSVLFRSVPVFSNTPHQP